MKYQVVENSLLIYVEFESHGNTLRSVITKLPLAFIDDVSALIEEYRSLSTTEAVATAPAPTAPSEFLPCVSVNSFSDGTRA